MLIELHDGILPRPKLQDHCRSNLRPTSFSKLRSAFHQPVSMGFGLDFNLLIVAISTLVVGVYTSHKAVPGK